MSAIGIDEDELSEITGRPARVDLINHPPHHAGDRFECIAVIEAYRLGFHLGNAFKYLVRHERKGTPRQDLEKALWYLDRFLAEKSAADMQRALGLTAAPIGFTGVSDGDVVESFRLPDEVASVAHRILIAARTSGRAAEDWIEDAAAGLRNHLAHGLAK